MRDGSWKIALLLGVVLTAGCNSSLPRPHPYCQRFENCMGDCVDHVGLMSPLSNQSLSHKVTRHYADKEHFQNKKYYRGIWATLSRWEGWY